MTDLFVSAICLSITYRLLSNEELIERTEKAIQIVYTPNFDDLIQLDKLVQLFSAKLELLQQQGLISEKMKFFKEDIKPKLLKTLEPFSAIEDAKLCLENNLLVFTVEYLKDLKQIRAIEEGS